jgi:flavin-dependent dehydrogenase
MSKNVKADVAIVGGGPAGSTVASFLKLYCPDLHVLVLEREAFPREHVGESLLPSACKVLAEMKCWDKVEAARFPIKIGATYRWGASPDLWDFEFLPAKDYRSGPRPGAYRGQRAQTAFQVERAKFDQILADHASSLGAEVRQACAATPFSNEDDLVGGLTLAGGETVSASIYVDASGNAGSIRKLMGVRVDEPTALRNVAFWSYWENADWAVSIGTDATRVLVLSISWGWIWFIPIGATRTSIGLVCPAEHYKKLGLSPEELYERALSEEPKISELCKDAARVAKVQGTKDWSFVAERLYGKNWFLVGESAGFADPILAAGLSLTLSGARELAFTIISLLQESDDESWLRLGYQQLQQSRIRQHIRFAEFWYSANGQFRELQEFTREIAADAGLQLNADQAFQWLGTGGFISDIALLPTLADVSLEGVKQLTQRFTRTKASWLLQGASVVDLNLTGATSVFRPVYREGKVLRILAYERDGKLLPIHGFYQMVLSVLSRERQLAKIVEQVRKHVSGPKDPVPLLFQVLEVWLQEGWITATADPDFPPFEGLVRDDSMVIHDNTDIDISSNHKQGKSGH